MEQRYKLNKDMFSKNEQERLNFIELEFNGLVDSIKHYVKDTLYEAYTIDRLIALRTMTKNLLFRVLNLENYFDDWIEEKKLEDFIKRLENLDKEKEKE